MTDQTEMHAGGRSESGLKSALSSLIFLAAMFFMNFVGRTVFSPLMPTIEADLGLGHTAAGVLFLMITLGYCLALFFQGFVPAKFTHRWTVVIATCLVAVGMLLAGLASSAWGLFTGLFILGVAAGLYLPSGIATLTALVPPQSWGRALAVHEMAPNFSFMASPLIAEGLLHWFDWQGVIIVIALASLALGLAYAWWGKGGRFHGQAPDLSAVRLLAKLPSFWVMVYLVCLGIAGSMGVFNMLPLYLVDSHGMSRPEANMLVSYSRMAGIGAAFVAGWATDALGPKRAIFIVFTGSGLATLALAWSHGAPLVAAVFAQPIFAVCFFPPGFAALSSITPPKAANLAVALGVGAGFVLGGGLLPTLVGYFGELGHFDWGLALTGFLILSGLPLMSLLRLKPSRA